MRDESVIQLTGVSKRFYYYENRNRSLREWFIRAFGGGSEEPIRRPEFLLQDISLTVTRGEAIALIGANGSGKSTVLRLMSGIYEPTTGQVNVSGRLVPVIELGVGFNPELTGIENIEVYAAVLRLSAKEVEKRMAQIIEFSELEEFIRIPVKYYSSGMRARLAFSVAIHSNPDILALDEVLAVGDRTFSAKSLQRLKEFHSQGGTLILVTHDLDQAASLCSRMIWLEHGRVRMQGASEEVVAAYEAASDAAKTAPITSS